MFTHRIVMLLLSLLAVLQFANAATEVNYCIPFDASSSVVSKCTEILGKANSDDVEFTCVKGMSATGCMRMINQGEAHLLTLDGGDLYTAWQSYGLLPIISENAGNTAGFEYYGVAIVNKDFCDDSPSLDKLRGKNACFTGFRGELVGWTSPLATIMQNVQDVQLPNNNSMVAADAEVAAGFFSNICAASDDGPMTGRNGEGASWEPLCTACKDNCDTSDSYYGYKGALRCLMDGSGDVAFTKHTVLLEYAKGGEEQESWATKSKDDFMLLCPDGGCKTPDEYDACFWSKAPSHTMNAPADWSSDNELGEKVKQALVTQGKDTQWVVSARELGELEGVIVDDETVSLEPVSITTLSDFMDVNAFNALKMLYDLRRPARFCVTDDKQLTQCNSIINTLAEYDRSSGGPGFSWGCVLRPDMQECLMALAEGSAEMLVVDGAEMYEGRTSYNLAPLVAEYYGDKEGQEYYAVAVVNKAFCDRGNVTLRDLRGRSSCHTGYRRSAGWWMPLAALSQQGLLKQEMQDREVAMDAQSMAQYFDKMCAAGVADGGPAVNEELEPTAYPELCGACKSNCSTADAYYSYVGAFRCLIEGAGEVAFTKHTVPASYSSDGDEAEDVDWNGKSKDDFRLLCPSGGCAAVDDYETCNFAAVPAHAIVVNHAYSKREEMKKFLVEASEISDVAEKIFEGSNEPFWGEDTKKLTPIDGTAKEYLGEAYDKYEELYKEGWVEFAGSEDFQPASLATRLCIPGQVDADTIKACTSTLSKADDITNDVTFKCVRGDSVLECMRMVNNGSADWVMLEPRDQYYSIDIYDLQPVISEDYGTGYGAGYSVAVVRSDMCKDGTTLKDLEGKKACFTAYDKFGGWQLPLGALYREGVLPVDASNPDVRPDAQSAVSFFGSVCAPGQSVNGPQLDSKGNAQYWEELCKGCKNGECTMDDDSLKQEAEGEDESAELEKKNIQDDADEDLDEIAATIKCLNEGGDVAFTLHTGVTDFASDGKEPQDWSKLKLADMMLMCPAEYGNGCKDVSEADMCNMGMVPPRAIMARASPNAQWSADVFAFLSKAGSDATWLNSLKKMDEYELLSNGTTGLVQVSDYVSAWGPVTIENLEEAEEINRPNVTWCVESQEAYDFCDSAKATMNKVQPHVTFDCYSSGQDSTCAAAISKGDADVAIMDSHDVYNAWTTYELQPIAAVDEGAGAMEYSAVAVVNKAFCDKPGVSLKDLRNVSSCHTGYRRTAGFVVPVGYLLVNDIMPYVDAHDSTAVQPDAESVASFFDKVCAARVYENGPKMTDDGKGATWAGMCDACSGDCTETDPYYDYQGTIRCLMEGKGQVAFTKHEAPLEYATDGTEPQEWSTLQKDDMRLLCPKGGCQALDNYDTCKFSDVPAHAAVARPGFVDRRRVEKALASLLQAPEFQMLALNSTSNPNEFLFEEETIGMIPVHDTVKYFGNALMLFQGFEKLDTTKTVAGRK